MKIAIGSDHGGIALKRDLVAFLREEGYAVIDFGPETDERCDYPDYGFTVAEAVADGKADRGILICKSGVGMCVVANKVRGVRAVSLHTEEEAILSRRHNDTNVAVFGAQFVPAGEAKRFLARWLATDFEGGRHADRICKIERPGRN